MNDLSDSSTSNTPIKILVALDKSGCIQVLDTEIHDLIAGGVVPAPNSPGTGFIPIWLCICVR
jgi:hypothetical protein